MSTPFHIVIPARYASTRLPGKALAEIAGRPLCWHVWQRAQGIGADSVTVATDDSRVQNALEALGVTVLMTRLDHASGTDRLAEVVALKGWPEDEIVVNLQGDEPLMPGANLLQVVELLRDDSAAVMATLCEKIHSREEFLDPAAVKVVIDSVGRALYFSRAPIPYPRDTMSAPESPINAQRHIGLYAYRAGFLRRFTAMPPSALEQLESLEQLRVLEAGAVIRVAPAVAAVPPGVDTPADLERVRQLMAP